MDLGAGIVTEWNRAEFRGGDESLVCEDKRLVHGGCSINVLKKGREGGKKERKSARQCPQHSIGIINGTRRDQRRKHQCLLEKKAFDWYRKSFSS